MSQCQKCNWWLAKADDNEQSTHMGECHRYPPQPFRSINDGDIKKVAASCTFPITHERDFCGEFKHP